MEQHNMPEEVKQVVLDILEPYNTYAAYLTGSRSYGFYNKDSDYDVVSFVVPDKEDLYLGKPMVSKVVKTDNALVEQVTVKDVRYLLNYLKRPTFNTLFMFQEPGLQFNERLFDQDDAVTALLYRKKEFLLSLGGVYRQRVAKGEAKDKAHALYLEQLFESALQSSTLPGLKPEECLAVRLGEKEYEFKDANFLLEKAKQYPETFDYGNFHMLLDMKMVRWLEHYYEEY